MQLTGHRPIQALKEHPVAGRTRFPLWRVATSDIGPTLQMRPTRLKTIPLSSPNSQGWSQALIASNSHLSESRPRIAQQASFLSWWFHLAAPDLVIKKIMLYQKNLSRRLWIVSNNGPMFKGPNCNSQNRTRLWSSPNPI